MGPKELLTTHGWTVIWVTIIGYPMLLGTLRWTLPIAALLSVLIAYFGFRLSRSISGTPSRRHLIIRWSSYFLSAYIGTLPLLGFVGNKAHERWQLELKNSSCGIKPGMTRDQALTMVGRCGRNVKEDGEGGFILEPSGLARLMWLDFGMYALSISYDKEDRVVEAQGWSD